MILSNLREDRKIDDMNKRTIQHTVQNVICLVSTKLAVRGMSQFPSTRMGRWPLDRSTLPNTMWPTICGQTNSTHFDQIQCTTEGGRGQLPELQYFFVWNEQRSDNDDVPCSWHRICNCVSNRVSWLRSWVIFQWTNKDPEQHSKCQRPWENLFLGCNYSWCLPGLPQDLDHLPK